MSIMQIIKRAAVDAVEQSAPVNVTYGIVVKVSPLEINVGQRFPIKANFILLASNVVDKETEISIDGGTRNKAVFFNALKAGDKVLLLRVQGGQKYIILDRLVEVET